MACSISAPTVMAAKGSAFAGRRPVASMRAAVASRPALATAALAEVATGRKTGKQLERAWKKGGSTAVEKPEYMELGRLLDTYDFKFNVGDKVTGSIFNVDNRGAYVDIGAKASAFMPTAEAAIVKLDSVRLSALLAPGTNPNLCMPNCPIPWPPPLRGARWVCSRAGFARRRCGRPRAPPAPSSAGQGGGEPQPLLIGQVIGRSVRRVHEVATGRNALTATGSLGAPSPTNCSDGKALNLGCGFRRGRAEGPCEGTPERAGLSARPFKDRCGSWRIEQTDPEGGMSGACSWRRCCRWARPASLRSSTRTTPRAPSHCPCAACRCVDRGTLDADGIVSLGEADAEVGGAREPHLHTIPLPNHTRSEHLRFPRQAHGAVAGASRSSPSLGSVCCSTRRRMPPCTVRW